MKRWFICLLIMLSALIVGLESNRIKSWYGTLVSRPSQPKTHPTNFSISSTDPALWKSFFPHQYKGFVSPIDTHRTMYGGNEAISSVETDSLVYSLFDGYPFLIKMREKRGHFFSLSDIKDSLPPPQSLQEGCFLCHSSNGISAINQHGKEKNSLTLKEFCSSGVQRVLSQSTDPISCINCHNPRNLKLWVQQPAFTTAWKSLQERQNGSIFLVHWKKIKQMRVFICAQCHSNYSFEPRSRLLFHPWAEGLSVEAEEEYLTKHPGTTWTHKQTHAELHKVRHPQFELWSTGSHAAFGVTCVDCHMPVTRDGLNVLTDHSLQSPMTLQLTACKKCHKKDMDILQRQVITIQQRTRRLLSQTEKALNDLLKEIARLKVRHVPHQKWTRVKEFQRRAQWRYDFIFSESSLGFHSPQEAARILATAIDLARQGQLEARRLTLRPTDILRFRKK